MSSTRDRRRVRTALGLAACLGLAAAAGRAEAQQERAVPRVPAGLKVAVFPVQAVTPAPSGQWPGGADSRADAREKMNAELGFALASAEGARGWPGPSDLVRMIERNPTIDADPRRLALSGLSGVEAGRDKLRATLHRQLRRLSALANVRIVAIPLGLGWRKPEPPASADTAVSDRPDRPGRTVLEVAMVDTRAARLLWRGELMAPPAAPDEPGSLATLASDFVRMLTP